MSASLDQDALHDFSVRGAQRCADCGVLEAWVHTYLRSGYWANIPLSEGLKLKERFWIGPTELRLDDIDRLCGPEDGMIYREPAELWERRVGQLLATIEDVLNLPPLIVHDANGTLRNQDGTSRFVIADGSHRFEALKRAGRESCHALVWFETAEQREEYLRTLARDTLPDIMESIAPPLALPAAALYAEFDTDPTQIVEFLAWLWPAPAADEPSPRVLDVGCGVGRLLPPLAARGWRVIGLEPDPEFAAYAAARIQEMAGVEVRRGGFTDVQVCAADVAPVDLVVGINGSFAYLATPAERADALTQCRRVLRPGGLLVLDLPNLLRVLFEYGGPATYDREADGRTIRLERRHRVDYDRALFITDERYEVREATGATWELRGEHPYAITSWPELAAALSAAGFGDLRTFTSFAARAPESLGAGRVLIVARAS